MYYDAISRVTRQEILWYLSAT